jgi:putative ATPase
VVYLATAPKSNSLYQAYSRAQEAVTKGSAESVPLHLRNPVTPLMKEMGYGKGYKYAHEFPGHFVEQQNRPDSIQGQRYYTPSDQGYERQVFERLKAWWQRKTKSEEVEPEKGEATNEEDLPPL